MEALERCKIIAEIGCNHKGDMSIAKEMIMVAKIFAQVDAVKFQKRNNRELLTEAQYSAPHPNTIHAYGKTYGEHREFLEFNIQQHKELYDYCNEMGIEYSCSVWDLTSAMEIASLQPKVIKIPSACNNNIAMIQWLCDNYPGEIHVSLGMTYNKEVDAIIELFRQKKRNKDLVLYNCTSGYPVPFEDICLLEIDKLKLQYGSTVKAIGFSGHHLGIAIDVAAYVLGAKVIERHFTLDRTWKGTDHAASLEPDGLRKLARNIRVVQLAMTYKAEEILPIEKEQRDKLKYRNA